MGEGGVTRRSFLKIVGGVVIAAGVGLGVIYYLSRGSQTPTTVRGIATTTITTPTSSPTSTPVGPARGGELRIELISEIVRLDPHASTAAVDRQVYQAIRVSGYL